MESPRYKTVRVTASMGIPYAAGAEIPVHGWPGNDVEPINESARRVVGWLGRYTGHPLKPWSPDNALAGGIYLAGVLPDFGPVGVFNPYFDTPQASTVAPVRESEVLPGMPLYRVNFDLHLGKTHVPAATDFAFLGWPLESFTPANEAAKAVKSYHDDNKDNPALLPSPWCCYRQGLVLPELPPIPEEKPTPHGAMDAAIKDKQHQIAAAARRDKAKPARM